MGAGDLRRQPDRPARVRDSLPVRLQRRPRLGLWDSVGAVQTVKDARDNQADIALRHPAMLDRLMIDLAPRQITVSLINANECIHCQRDKTTATPP